MKKVLFLVAMLIPSVGWAQDVVWAKAETASTRFPDAEVAGPMFAANERLTVLARDGNRIRVMGSAEYGWIPAAAVTETMPLEFDPLGSLGLELPPGLTVTPGK